LTVVDGNINAQKYIEIIDNFIWPVIVVISLMTIMCFKMKKIHNETKMKKKKKRKQSKTTRQNNQKKKEKEKKRKLKTKQTFVALFVCVWKRSFCLDLLHCLCVFTTFTCMKSGRVR
jgi:predicted histidine transporter YuiF (NhaC family)